MDSGHIGVHVEDLPDLGGHFDDADVAEVDGMALLRSFMIRSRCISSHHRLTVWARALRTEQLLSGQCGHVFRLGRRTTSRLRS